VRPLVFLALLLPLAAHAQVGLLSLDEAARLKQTGRSQWRQAANAVLHSGPWSVTTHRPPQSKAGPHDFYSSSEFNANRQDLHTMCDAVLTLGAAAYATGERRYARRAAELLDVWFLAPRTYMNPDLDFAQTVPGIPRGRGTGVTDGRDLVWCTQGVLLAESSPGWDHKTGDRVRGWFRRYLCWLLLSRKSDDEKNSGDARSAWWAAQVGAYANFVQDRDAVAGVRKFVDSGKARLDLDPQAHSLVNRLNGKPEDLSGFPGTAWDRMLQALTATPRQEPK
jgi:hypothetical protein